MTTAVTGTTAERVRWRELQTVNPTDTTVHTCLSTQLMGTDDWSAHVKGVAASGDGSVYITGETDSDLDGETRIGIRTNAFSPSTRLRATGNGPSCWALTAGIPWPTVAVSGDDGSVYITGFVQNGETHHGFVIAFSPSTRLRATRNGPSCWASTAGIPGPTGWPFRTTTAASTSQATRRRPRRDAHRNP